MRLTSDLLTWCHCNQTNENQSSYTGYRHQRVFYKALIFISEEIKENNMERIESLNKQAVFSFVGNIFANSTVSQRK